MVKMMDELPIFAPVPSDPHGSIGQHCDLLAYEREIHRELELRRKVYPGWVTAGRIDQKTADMRIRLFEKLLQYIKAILAQFNTQS